MKIASMKRVVRLLSRPIADADRVTPSADIDAFADACGTNLWIEWTVKGQRCVSIWVRSDDGMSVAQVAMRCLDGLFVGADAVLAAHVIAVVAERVAKAVARTAQPAPVALWELRLPGGSTTPSNGMDEDEGDEPAPQSAPVAGSPAWIRYGIRVEGINEHAGQEGILERSLPADEGRSRERWAVTGDDGICIWAGSDEDIEASWKPSEEEHSPASIPYRSMDAALAASLLLAQALDVARVWALSLNPSDIRIN